MPKKARLKGSVDQIKLSFVERETRPEFLMKLSIQLQLSVLSLSNIIRVLEILGVLLAQSTIRNYVPKVDLQPESGKNPDHVAVKQTEI